MIFARIATLLYILWGLAHVVAAYKVFLLGQSIEEGMLQGRIYQNAWNLLFFAVAAIVIAVVFNWKNSKTGYWINLALVSVGDIGFIITILMPGYLTLMPGVIGPVVWLLAMLFSTLAILKKNKTTN